MTYDKKQDGIDIKLIDELIATHYRKPEDLLGENGLLAHLTRRVVERALAGELTYHLGYAKGQAPPASEASAPANCRNGYSAKTLISEHGPMPIAVPRDRDGSFEPLLIGKGQRRFEGFDQRIIAMYARGMTVREIQGFLLDQYKVEVSAAFISTVTDAVVEAMLEWQNRPLEALYPVVYFDALRVKIRDEGTVKNKAVYFALGLAADGAKKVLGFWIEQSEGAKFWLKVMNELRNRGVADILIAVVDGLKGFPEAITAVFVETRVQTCIVHLTRHSLALCSWPCPANSRLRQARPPTANEPAPAHHRTDLWNHQVKNNDIVFIGLGHKKAHFSIISRVDRIMFFFKSLLEKFCDLFFVLDDQYSHIRLHNNNINKNLRCWINSKLNVFNLRNKD